MKNMNLKHAVVLSVVAMSTSALASQTSVYGKRYCEIVYSKNYMDFYVYNSNNLHECPHAWWKGIDQNAVKKETNAQYVFLNGPRVWVVDDIVKQPVNYPTSHFKGKPLHLVGTFHSDFQSLLRRHGPYTDYKINRDQAYMLHKGREVVELVNPQGQVYVLHSLSMKKRAQSPNQISQLKNHIKLPTGWSFKSGNLNSDYRMASSGHVIHIVQDELENTYQMIGKDLLK